MMDDDQFDDDVEITEIADDDLEIVGTAEEIGEEIFFRKDDLVKHAWILQLTGYCALAGAAVGFLVMLRIPHDTITLHMLTTLPTLVGLGALFGGRSLANTPTQATVGPLGIVLETKQGTKRWSWDEIGWAKVDTSGMTHQKTLYLYGAAGKQLTTLSHAFDDFDRMDRLILEFIAAKGDDTAQRVQFQKARRLAWTLFAFGAFMAFAAAFIRYETEERKRADHLLETSAVAGSARIVDRRLAPNGVTPRLEYEVTGADGKTAVRNAEVTRETWDALAGQTDVAVIYVPTEPEISRLVAGEVSDEDDFAKSSMGGTLLALAGAGMSLFSFVVGLFAWFGWDIDLDSKSGKISIKRFGTGR